MRTSAFFNASGDVEMNPSAVLNKMYFTVIGLLPLRLFIVIVGNSLVVNQADSDSMAYVLATPTSAAPWHTQAIFLLAAPLRICTVVCSARCAASQLFTGKGKYHYEYRALQRRYLTAEAARRILVSCGL